MCLLDYSQSEDGDEEQLEATVERVLLGVFGEVAAVQPFGHTRALEALRPLLPKQQPSWREE